MFPHVRPSRGSSKETLEIHRAASLRRDNRPSSVLILNVISHHLFCRVLPQAGLRMRYFSKRTGHRLLSCGPC